MSAAIDYVDHAILMYQLKNVFGIDDIAMKWITPFLSDRSQQISYNGKLSISIRIPCGVPQGSVLDPLLCLLYFAELFELISQCGFGAHCYAGDAQVFTSSPSSGVAAAVESFSSCIEQIDRWLKSNRLKLVVEKTQVIWLGTRQQLAKVHTDEIQLLYTSVPIFSTVMDLGVTLDSSLTMSQHVAAVFQLRSATSATCSEAITIE